MIVCSQSLGIRAIDVSRIEEVVSLLAGWESVPLWLIVLTLGMVPAVLNSSLPLMAHFRGSLAEWNLSQPEQTHLPIAWLAGAR